MLHKKRSTRWAVAWIEAAAKPENKKWVRKDHMSYEPSAKEINAVGITKNMGMVFGKDMFDKDPLPE